ncbi:MAG: hypothetical protein AAGH41_00305 [Pseudomonadota bacterium]
MAAHASYQHNVVAQNIARADIPDARRLLVSEFERSLRRAEQGNPPRTREGRDAIRLETEMLSMAEAKGRHDSALTIWKSTLKMMRLAIGAPQA